MKENIKIGISVVTMVFVAFGFYFTIDQVRSTNEIRIERNRSDIIASTEDDVFAAIMSNSGSQLSTNTPKTSEARFLRALFNHYTDVYRMNSTYLSIFSPLSDGYVARVSHQFCWLKQLPMAEAYWNSMVKAHATMRRIGKLEGIDISEIEDEWCAGSNNTGATSTKATPRD